jgi:hypothetical protein
MMHLSPQASALAQAAWRRAAAVVRRRAVSAPHQAPPAVTLTVEASRELRAISPLIYGVAVAGKDDLDATGARLNRWGGNPNSRYNWEAGSAWNAARDWEFRNYGETDGTAQAPSSAADAFIAVTRNTNAEPVLTVPAVGWVARNGRQESRSLDVPASGGPPAPGSRDNIAGYDAAANRRATSIRSRARKDSAFADPPDLDDDTVYQDEWVNHLVRRFGSAASGGVRYYVIDNEPDLWSETHTDVHPVQLGYDDSLGIFLEYATAIKDVDPTALVLGPALSGWTAYFFSARDRGGDNFRSRPERRAHGGMPFLPWWLQQVRQYDERVGRRTLDVLDVHYYPQAPGVFSDAADDETNARRLRSTRSLWDPGYADESWIGEPIRLIPRLREWIDQFYPGTKLAIGEWNWGADKTMNGALAIAEVLGIFGREGVDLAAYWTFPPHGSPGASAFRMFTNYDGQGHGFGDVALAARSSAPDDVTVFASRDAVTGDLLVLAINKRADADLHSTFRLNAFDPAAVSLYRLTRDDPAAIASAGITAAPGGEITVTLPAYSITLLRISSTEKKT